MSESSPPPERSAIASFVETIESLVVAFILAFVFRAFVVEAFVIPTGSMADTLRGAHFHLVCENCGYDYNFGFVPQAHGYQHSEEGAIPPTPIPVMPRAGLAQHDGVRDHSNTGVPVCPMCGCAISTQRQQRVNNGDRILVLKYLYQFVEPSRWDAIVFKNPREPRQNYIKRLIGRPGETVELIDGDIYINGEIKRKPEHVQRELWIEVFRSDYHRPLRGGLHYVMSDHDRMTWEQPLITDNPAAWDIDFSAQRFAFNGADAPAALAVNQARLNFALANFDAYNGYRTYRSEAASDLKMAFVVTPSASDGAIEIILGKYGRTYAGRISFDGRVKIIDRYAGATLATGQFAPPTPDRPVAVSFANVDHRLDLRVGEEQLIWDGPSDPRAWGYEPGQNQPMASAHLTAQGAPFSLRSLILYRDVHYTNSRQDTTGQAGHGTEGNPLTLDPDQFYVLGDNSPVSGDSRAWGSAGLGNRHITYEPGIVPRDYLIGRAFFVYWPAGYSLHPRIRFSLVPNVGAMRFIH